jgi:tetratricopeptide (TPR) repeat protein/V8-like Glu-specific endopeptidase
MNLLKLGPALSYLPLGKSLVLATLAITAAISSVALQQGSAIAQVISSSAITRDIDRNEINKSRNVTVKILGATEGSGVLIGHDDETHTVLTAWHVISSNNKNEEITIQTFDNRKHTTNIEESIRIGNLDLAIIRFKSNVQYKAVNYPGKDLTPSDMLYVMGYPNTTGTYRKTVGTLIASADVGIDQGYQLLYTNNTQSGMSGGPIFDSKYNLIGVHGRGEYNNLKNNNSLQKTNINQGIHIFYYDQYKNGRPIKAESKDPMTWSDYMALYNSTEKQTESNYDKKNIDYKPTLLRLVEMMIRLKPNQSMNYILRADIMTDNNYNIETPDIKKSLQLISEYQSIQKEIAQLMEMGDRELVLKKLLSLDDYVYSVGSENHLLKSYVYLARNEPNKALKSAIFALEMELEAYDDGRSVTTKQVPSEVIISGAYSAKGRAYFQLGKFEDAVYALKSALRWRDRAQLFNIDMKLLNDNGEVFGVLGASYYQILKNNSAPKNQLVNSYRLTKNNSTITLKDVCDNLVKAIRNGSEIKLPSECNANGNADIIKSVEADDIKSNIKEVNIVYAEIRESYNVSTHDTTIKRLDKLIDLDDEFALTYYLKGQAFYNLKEYRKCLEEMNRTIEIQPAFHDAYFQRALCKEDLGDTNGALDDYAIVQDIKPSLDVHYNVAMLYSALATEDNNNKLHLNKALMSIIKGIKIAEANKVFLNSPAYSAALGYAGVLYGKVGDMNNACLYLKKAVASQHKNSIELIGKLRKEGACL